jgi:hypothetical protein
MVITLRNATSLLENVGPLSERHTPLCCRGATELQSSHQDAIIGRLTCEFADVMRCQSTRVPSFHGALGTLSIGFRTPPDDMKSRVGAMISQ